MQWLNEPAAWRIEGETLTITAGPQTDFWRKTHDGGIRDNGHFYGREMAGDFSAQVKITGQYADLYDQAGLMVRLDTANWLKCGVEYVKGTQHVSAVVTRDWSDWSVLPLNNPPEIWLRIVRQAATVETYFSVDGISYTMFRQAFLPEQSTVQVGPMIAAPIGHGFTARFEGFSAVAT